MHNCKKIHVNNIYVSPAKITKDSRAALKGQRPFVIWMTGLSGSGKSTLANSLEEILYTKGRHTMLMDGDNVRHSLNRDLGFTEVDRIENIRRVGEVARLMVDAGLIVITAFISPFQADRDMVRSLFSAGEFMEIYLTTSLDVCEKRDTKGLYHKARIGEIPNFTGITSPYEPPVKPELRIDTTSISIINCANSIIDFLLQNKYI